ncbi:ParB N-terminal domain-containing protein [Burkholderia multivorans]|uniref:ParB/RepB/Spo0J family partition protein n=1 Tax=Burkholderia multivorans TaxID=87883 RepID=UPI0020188CAF|nr:ParB N-terminal domain-containing protein [Burkholderia multivorans]MCL4664469.1 ParB N-terminal domain-containing protein [Burkholderia multivorans]MCO1355863.1 ParB N-terminal domain-containing protein [Burkholderia multivorans]MCO1415953.1 ParB N-terminal domain-containing protein [Burkholderia multivorans]MCO1449895.1 ParB N-terminal domain-containing protein [Burkholderia multivorans]UQP43352.1 ParB N-terminal domain-containing protein [Burkholderia multivorans]
MAKNSIDAYGAAGKSNVLFFDPDTLTLITDPAHPLFDRRALLPYDEAMVRNIRHRGVLETILVHKDPETGEVIVVDGRRRVIAAREANRRLRDEGLAPIMVPALPKRGKQAELAGMMVATNEHREHDSPINRAEKMQRLRDLGYDDEQIAAEFRVEPPTVAASLRLLDCTAAVRDALEADQINVSHALKLAKLSPDEQREKVKVLIAAAEGKQGHERSRAQKAALTGDAAPRMRTRKQISAELAKSTGERAAALRWVLNLDCDGPAAVAADPRQMSIEEAA